MAGLINFEDEQEVKEYLDNIKVEYSYQCYREKDLEGCHRLGEYMETIKADFDSASQIFKRNCEEKGNGDSCFKLGCYHVNGQGGIKRCLKEAYSCFVKACNSQSKRSLDACRYVAQLAETGEAFDNGPNFAVARDYYEMGCEKNFASSCFGLSTLYLRGGPGLEKNMPLALKYSLKACELNEMWGCSNASFFYTMGEGIEKDEKKAKELREKAKKLRAQVSERPLQFGL